MGKHKHRKALKDSEHKYASQTESEDESAETTLKSQVFRSVINLNNEDGDFDKCANGLNKNPGSAKCVREKDRVHRDVHDSSYNGSNHSSTTKVECNQNGTDSDNSLDASEFKESVSSNADEEHLNAESRLKLIQLESKMKKRLTDKYMRDSKYKGSQKSKQDLEVNIKTEKRSSDENDMEKLPPQKRLRLKEEIYVDGDCRPKGTKSFKDYKDRDSQERSLHYSPGYKSKSHRRKDMRSISSSPDHLENVKSIEEKHKRHSESSHAHRNSQTEKRGGKFTYENEKKKRHRSVEKESNEATHLKEADKRLEREWDHGKLNRDHRHSHSSRHPRESEAFGDSAVQSERFDSRIGAGAIKDAPKSIGKKEEPNFSLSGKLTEYTNTYNGVVIKYNEPAEARKPKTRWRLYPFKGDEGLEMLPIHRQSAYLLGRDRKIADIPVDHPSCSKQHAVLQFRLVDHVRADGSSGRRVKPYIIDLETTNGTYVNNNRIEPRRYVELIERDVLKFGFSSRDYVLLHEKSQGDVDDDVDDEGEAADSFAHPKRAKASDKG